jgi:hypothetical protein
MTASHDALMALDDPKTIRIDEGAKADRASINGVSLLPPSKTLEMRRRSPSCEPGSRSTLRLGSDPARSGHARIDRAIGR